MLRSVVNRLGMIVLLVAGTTVAQTRRVAAEPHCNDPSFCSTYQVVCGGECANYGGVLSYTCEEYAPSMCQSFCDCVTN